jgi:segregation and condensation protein A
MNTAESDTNPHSPFKGAPFSIEIDNFLGPIDLLLHLVKSNELEIETVSLAHVADQYVACLDKMQDLDLEIAGEYLVIAATLLSIKSAVLLEQPIEMILDDEGNLVDPHEELLRRLKEAAVYKEGASYLAALPLLGQDVFAAPATLSDYPTPEETFRVHDPFLLGIAFKRLMEKSGQEGFRYQVTLDSVSIVERMMNLLNVLQAKPDHDNPFEGYTFQSLVKSASPEINSANIVGTFVDLLELCKRQVLLVGQNKEGEILVRLKKDSDIELSGLSSEFDKEENAEEALSFAV